jgi:phosphoribosylformylglycinamidine synthase
MADLRDTWEATSFQLERLQCNPACVEQEERSMALRTAPPMTLTFVPTAPKAMPPRPAADAPKVCVLREEGSNGDREMVAAFSMAGFEVWDATMSDLVEGRLTLERFRGLVFVGGFSYADVCGSAKVCGYANGLL